MLVTGRKPPQKLTASWVRLPALLCLVFAISGCSLVPDIRYKPQTINPFPQIRTVAVLPFINQSKEPTLSGERVALAYCNELQSIRGFDVVPLGAVQLKLQEYQGPLARGEDFQAFAQFLGVDVVLVGSVTDYDPYYPPRMTMSVNWYAANPGFHPVLPGYGLPWGTQEEKDIPRWIHLESQRALAAEQLKTQTPVGLAGPAIMPEDRRLLNPPAEHEAEPIVPPPVVSTSSVVVTNGSDETPAGAPLPHDWPDPRGFIPDAPSALRPPMLAQPEPIMSHMRGFNGHDEDFTEQLADYFYFRDDARFGGWQAYLQRSEDFIRFCCYLHVTETLTSRGGQDKSRLIFRWPIDRYTR